MEDHKRGSHTVQDCEYHLVRTTKYLYSILAGDFGKRCATTVCKAHQRSRLERLCRYMARPPIGHQRLLVDARRWIDYRYKQSFRDGSAHVMLEPLHFMAIFAVLVPT